MSVNFTQFGAYAADLSSQSKNLLMWMHQVRGDNSHVFIVTKEWIGSLNASRSQFYKWLKELKDKGYIKEDGRTIAGFTKYVISLIAGFLLPKKEASDDFSDAQIPPAGLDNPAGGTKGIPPAGHTISKGLVEGVKERQHTNHPPVDNLDATTQALEFSASEAQNQFTSPLAEKTLARSKTMKKPLTTFSGPKTIPDDWRVYCQQNKPRLNPDVVYEAFADHWITLGEKKRDWNLTWRNWVRRERSPLPKAFVAQKFSQTIYEESSAI